MTTQLPDWIRLDGAIGDLTALVPELDAAAALGRHWRQIDAAIRQTASAAPVDSPVALATYVAAHLEDPAVITVFDELGLADLHGSLAGVAQRFGDPAAPWAKLLMPADAFAETFGAPPAEGQMLDDGDNPGFVALEIPKLAADASTEAGPAGLTFGIAATTGLECEAGAVWPFRGDAVPPGLLRLGAAGSVSAKAGVSLPFGKLGSGSISAAGSAEARLDFFFRPTRPEAPFAEILAPALTSVPNPLDLSEVRHAAELSGLEGILLACEGAASAGLAAKIGTGLDIQGVASLTAGLVAELQFKREARWLLSLRQVPEGLRFVLSRNLSRERDWSVGIDLAVDYVPLARQVHEVLKRADGLAQPLLSRIAPFLSPGTYLMEEARGLLDTAIASIVTEPGLRAALDKDFAALFGTAAADGDLALANYLRERIADLAAAEPVGLLADAQTWARGIATGLAARVPALGESGLADALTARIKPLLADVQRAFAGALDTLKDDAALDAELARIGAKLSGAGAIASARADQRLGALRKLVGDLDGFSRELIEKTGTGVAHKLQARFGWTGGDKSGVQYELAGVFNDAGPEAAALWRALVTGRLEPFQRILAHPALAPACIRLDPGSSMTRFAGTHRGFALEVVVLDLGVSISSIVSGQASIEVSASGDVVVTAEGSAERQVKGFDEGRGASFVSTWDLALHKAQHATGGTRRMAIALTFDHADSALDAREVTGFLGGLAAQGLVESARVTRAQEVYQEWRTGTPPGKKVQGRIEVQMGLTADAVGRMIALGREVGAKGGAKHYALFAKAVRALVGSGVTQEEKLERDAKEARREFRELAGIADPYRVVYGLQDIDLTPPETAGHRGYRYVAFEQIVPRAAAFPRLLATMAQIYDAIPVGLAGPGPQWSEKDYARAEESLARDARIWLRLNQKLIFWFKAELHPVLLAFLRLLADMNRPLIIGSDPFDTLEERLDVARSSGLFTIRMTPGTAAGAVVAV